MSHSRRTAPLLTVGLLCLLALLAGPAVAAGDAVDAGSSDRLAENVGQVDEAEAEADANATARETQGCFTGGSSFTIGSSDDTHIWVRLHLGPLTDSGTAFGGELVGSAEGAATIEVAAGAEYVADGVGALASDPLEAFAVVTGFEFRLPVFDDLGSKGLEEERTPTVDTTAENGGSDDVVLEGPFDTLEC
ncbi:hypothetical protein CHINAEXTREME_19745 [Halobiforma lacisalsi AJ5]|uniref:Uncharacterized protein n=1 Tax=Natronobacterium lacisalsi AJ5 TaxID=358396 RepID=M0LQV7_NATLA|nr:hypothetical protein [Halobiforma lacisalsi]APW99866.1 hypothetical protein CHINAEXTREME_19745 [Halobiforma lacisalsi AJ5]EMA35952.1 hypothetical protein C445_03813 [Halobiforma lacisalsi AJ5]